MAAADGDVRPPASTSVLATYVLQMLGSSALGQIRQEGFGRSSRGGYLRILLRLAAERLMRLQSATPLQGREDCEPCRAEVFQSVSESEGVGGCRGKSVAHSTRSSCFNLQRTQAFAIAIWSTDALDRVEMLRVTGSMLRFNRFWSASLSMTWRNRGFDGGLTMRLVSQY
ncbi:hypothetical protein BKA80DRAFT_252448 [Phyllosticta citrichinensis]